MSVTCRCGRASLRFTNPRPRKCIECCCCDCTLALQWAEKQGGPPAPEPPLKLIYFDNDLKQIRGEKHMQAVKLRKGGASRRIVSTCCHTTLAVDHWAYSGNVVMVLPMIKAVALAMTHDGETVPVSEGGRLDYEGSTAPEIRIQTKWWDAEKRGPLPPFRGESYTSADPWWAVSCGLLAHFRTPPARPLQGQTVQQLLERLGKPLIAGVDEPPLPGHFATGMGPLSVTLSDGTVPFAAVVILTTICTLYVALWDGDWPTTSKTVASYCATGGVLACMVSRLLYPN